MAKIVAITACPTGIAHTIMAAEALKKTAALMGHEIQVETQGSVGTQDVLTPEDIAAADVVIVASDIQVNMDRFAGLPAYATSTSKAIRSTQDIITAAVQKAPVDRQAMERAEAKAAAAKPVAEEKRHVIVGITSCPTGIAHTFMAAEGLKKGAEALGHQIKVETQGSVGSQNTLTAEDIAAADLVIIAADTKIDLSRFSGKPIYETSTKAAIKDGQDVVKRGIQSAAVATTGTDYYKQVTEVKEQQKGKRTGPYKHLMTGVSFMLPFIVAGGLLIAIGFALGGIYVYDAEGTLGWALFQIGATGAFTMIVPILAGYIAFSIADRPGLAPGVVGGVLAANIGAGFLGGIVAGFLAGYLTAWLNKLIKLPKTLEGLKPVLILPLISTGIVGLLMILVIGKPVSAVLDALTAWLTSMQTTGALLLGLILGLMMAFDMGGPVNKAAYAFSVGLIASQIYQPMAAVMAAGMTPPLGLALATFIFKSRFTNDEVEAGKAASVLGISFITEGAIPFAARDPLRVIPALMAGSAVAGMISMAAGCELRVPHGGIFVLPIPNAVVNLPMYMVAIVAGTLVTTAMLFLLKRPLARVEPAAPAPAAA